MMPADKVINDYSEWSYSSRLQGTENVSINVSFDGPKNMVKSISCMGDEKTLSHTCPSLAGVEIGDTEEQVQDKLGKPNRNKLDGVSKTIRYDDLGIEFILTKGQVYLLTLMNTRADAHIILMRYIQSMPTSVVSRIECRI